MKINLKSIGTAMLWLLTTACLHDGDVFQNNNQSAGLTVNLGVDVAVKNADERTLSEDPGNYRIEIFSIDDTPVISFNRYSDMPDTLSLDPGSYYVKASSGYPLPGGFDSPYYEGYSDSITLTPEETRSVSVMCSLANCKLSVSYSQNITGTFYDYYTVVSNEDTSITFTRDESRDAYFELKPVSLTAHLEYYNPDSTTAEKILDGTIDEPMKQKYYEVRFDANLTDPGALISVNVDESVTTQVVNINDQSGGIPGNSIGYGDLLITEIMYNPASMSDTYGEWFEVYNSTADSIDLYHLVIEKNAQAVHTVDEHILLPADRYIAFVKTDSACNAELKYTYGGSLSLTNGGDELSLANYGTDGSNGNVIATVDYGAAGFPTGTGASICLNPDHLQVDEAMNGSNWCTSSSAYSTGDLGTPGLVNDNCD